MRKFKRPSTTPKENSTYTIWSRHSDPLIAAPAILSDGTITVASFDPALKNLAFRVERFPAGSFEELTELKFYTRYDLLLGTSIETPLTEAYRRISSLLEDQVELLSSCHYILIERQMQINYQMTRLAQHLITLICELVRDRGVKPLVLEWDAHLKTAMLFKHYGLKRKEIPDIKVWMIKYAEGAFDRARDVDSRRLLSMISKKDDLADVKGQISAFQLMWQAGTLRI